ncbi:zinc-ribbon domain-containing protein [Haloarcula rubripromontorii]|uniref:Zinc-ribbon domain-containing protein n=1 Tax=Haloarcula rubripromontorii TaxID=1705562 RepID=A0A847U216_9EURY|nr:zinc-ribbon domain-containing protein [Haloarcula rubripromontorii]
MSLGVLPSNMMERLRRVVGTRQQSHLECRRCGTTLETDATTCPVCGSGDIARYDL